MEYSKHNNNFIFAIAFVVGLVGAAWVIKSGLVYLKETQRIVTVKGLAEQNVEADIALWLIQQSAVGDVLEDAYAKLAEDEQKIMQFLQQQGFSKDEIEKFAVQVEDRAAAGYQEFKQRYTVRQKLKVKTIKVNQVAKAAKALGELIHQGVNVGQDSEPKYLFTKLNEVKPEMLAIATRNARAAAEQFAHDSGSQVGQLRSARQGSFQILHPDSIPGEEYLQQQSQSLFKRVRVVTTLEYHLKD